jgi:D-3-phosphoglycerate dehydrogenase
VDGVICGDDRFSDRVLAAAPRLKVISKWGTGIDSIDRQACARRGIALCNTPNAFSEPVADSVLGYMLAFARRLPWMDRAMKGGVWDKIPGAALGEQVLGVIGVGDVGRAVVRRAIAFGMRVLGTDIRAIDAGFMTATGLEMVALDELLGAADFVSVNCDLNPTSLRLMNAGTLSRMRPSAVLINTARGPIVDEIALISALRHGAIAGAALDVFEHEPLPEDSPLRAMDNVLLAPHNSNSSPRAWERVHENSIANLLAVLMPEGRG